MKKIIIGSFFAIILFAGQQVFAVTIDVEKQICRIDYGGPYQSCDDGLYAGSCIAAISYPSTAASGQSIIFSATARLFVGGGQSTIAGVSCDASTSLDINSMPPPNPLGLSGFFAGSATNGADIGTLSITAPSAAGTYNQGFAAGFTPTTWEPRDGQNRPIYEFPGFSYGVASINVNNNAPILNLSGQAAFFSPLFTPVFGQNTNQQSSSVSANVDVTKGRLVNEEERSFTLGGVLESKQGTQADVYYGVQVFNKDNAKLVDEFSLTNPIILTQNVPVEKQILYTLPRAVFGNLDFYFYARTGSGIPLGTAHIFTRVIPQASSTVILSSCAIVDNELSCKIINTSRGSQTVTLGTQVKRGVSSFSPVLTSLPTQTLTLLPNKTVTYTQNISSYVEDVFFETFLAQEGVLQARANVVVESKTNTVTIDNALITQTSAKKYDVTIVSRTPFFARPKGSRLIVTLDTNNVGSVCATAQAPFREKNEGFNTSLSLAPEQICKPIQLTATLVDAQGTVIDTYTTPYTNTFIPEPRNWLFPLLALIAIVCVGLFVVLRKRA